MLAIIESVDSIIESVDSICRDSADTQYMLIHANKFLKISKTANL